MQRSRHSKINLCWVLKEDALLSTNFEICDLLKVAAYELPDLTSAEDPMRSQIITIAIEALERLQADQEFANLLWERGDLSRAIALKVRRRKARRTDTM